MQDLLLKREQERDTLPMCARALVYVPPNERRTSGRSRGRGAGAPRPGGYPALTLVRRALWAVDNARVAVLDALDAAAYSSERAHIALS
jgi:hypothetical protein